MLQARIQCLADVGTRFVVVDESQYFRTYISNYVENGQELTRMDAIFGFRMKICINIVLRDFIRRFLIAQKELVADDVVS